MDAILLRESFEASLNYFANADYLSEGGRRLTLSNLAMGLGKGGIKYVSDLTGVSQSTLYAGIEEIQSGNSAVTANRSREKGGGRKTVEEKQPGITDALKEVIRPFINGDPMTGNCSVSMSARSAAEELQKRGFTISHNVVYLMLKEMKYSLKKNKKNKSYTTPPEDRNTQFENIDQYREKSIESGNPVLSIDTKKKETIGLFSNNGYTWSEKSVFTETLDHDFKLEEGIAVPHGVYDCVTKQGYVSVGVSKDTAQFAVNSLRGWWNHIGKCDYANATELVITADCGGSNGYRVRLFKWELQKFANEIQKPITVLHYPPGTSKWNPVEHQMFSFISIKWRGQPLVSLAMIVSLIGKTTTKSGLKILCESDNNTYEIGEKVSDEDFESINLTKHEYRGEWNYTISPNKTDLQVI
jgi:transposase